MQAKRKLHGPILLSEEAVKSIPEVLNWFFEYWVFFRWIFFKNRPRGNLLLLRNILIVSAFGCLYFQFVGEFSLVLEGIEIDPIMALAGAIVIGNWKLTSVFSGKVMACSQLHIETLKAASTGQSLQTKTLQCALALRLLGMDLWAHRGFSEVFATAIEDSLVYVHQEHPDGLKVFFGSNNLDELYKKIYNKKLTATEARFLLDTYNRHLVDIATNLDQTLAA